MIVNYAPYEGEDKVQVRALLVPKSIHDQIKRDAANDGRTITMQTVAILLNHYAGKEGKAEKK